MPDSIFPSELEAPAWKEGGLFLLQEKRPQENCPFYLCLGESIVTTMVATGNLVEKKKKKSQATSLPGESRGFFENPLSCVLPRQRRNNKLKIKQTDKPRSYNG